MTSFFHLSDSERRVLNYSRKFYLQEIIVSTHFYLNGPIKISHIHILLLNAKRHVCTHYMFICKFISNIPPIQSAFSLVFLDQLVILIFSLRYDKKRFKIINNRISTK